MHLRVPPSLDAQGALGERTGQRDIPGHILRAELGRAGFARAKVQTAFEPTPRTHNTKR